MFRCSRAAEPEPLRVGVAVPLAVPVFLVPFTTFGDFGVGDTARLAARDAAYASAAFFELASFCAFSRSFAAKNDIAQQSSQYMFATTTPN